MCDASFAPRSSLAESFFRSLRRCHSGLPGRGPRVFPELIAEIIQLATEGLTPDLTACSSISRSKIRPLVLSAAETAPREGSSRRRKADDFHERVRAAYLHLAESEPERIKIVNTNQPPDLTHQRVKEIVIPFLRSRGHAIAEKFEAASSENPK